MAPFDPANGAVAIAASAVDAAPSRPATIAQAANDFIISLSWFFQSDSHLRQAAIVSFPEWVTASFGDAVGVGKRKSRARLRLAFSSCTSSGGKHWIGYCRRRGALSEISRC
jgi:hypothetical protein